jgi:hypothetical protein
MSKGEPLINTMYLQYDYPSQVDPGENTDFADPPQKLNLKWGDYAIYDFTANDTWELMGLTEYTPEIKSLKELAEDLKLIKKQCKKEGKKRNKKQLKFTQKSEALTSYQNLA